MSKYTVVLQDNRTVAVEVEAVDENDAKEKAAQGYNFNELEFVFLDGEITPLDVFRR